MKRIVIGTVIVIGLIGTANADSKHAQRAKADLPDCRGVSSPEQIASAKSAKSDPAVAFAKKHAKTAMPASVVCQSKLWQALHGNLPRTLSVEKDPALSASRENRERKQAGSIGSVTSFAARPAPGPVGPPSEMKLQKASGKVFDLRTLPSTPPRKRERPEREAPPVTPQPMDGGVPTVGESNSTVQAMAGPRSLANAPAPGPLTTFDGLDNANWGAGHPPDTNGDAGPTYYIQTINTSIGIYRKSDGFRMAAFTFDTFMSQGNFGNLCDTDNFGDPVVLYDSFEDRWIISDFAFQLDGSNNVINPPGSFQCFAVSMTGDPVSGGWNYYSINTTGGLGDYPKLGIWPDGLYMSANMFDYAAAGAFQNSRLYAFNKAQMYAGAANIQSVSFNLPSDQFTVLPANARLQTGTPPLGSPNYFASVWNFLNSVQIWKFHVDWGHPSQSSVTGPFNSTMSFWWEQYGRVVGGNTVTTAPTPANSLDTLYPRVMVQNQYSNIGGVESLWDSHTVGAGNPTSSLTSTQSAVRYYQFNVTGGTVAASATQNFTYSPDATVYRYMPSAAVDRAGDMAIGYTTSNATTNPALKYAGRLAGDAANSITQTEQLMFQGTGSQSGTCGTTCERWGDYSAMTLDPDGCTFWYTNEYYATTGLNHQTRIGAFKYPSCTPVGAGGTISGTVTAAVGGAPISGATVQFGARSTTTNGSGAYSFASIPAGTYPSITASFPGYVTGSASSIVVTDGGTTTQNFSLAAAATSACLTDTTQTDFQTGVPTSVDLTTSAGNVILASPDSVDQITTNYTTSGVGFSNTSFAAQTFTPGVTGALKRIDVNIFCATCSGANPNLTLEARTTSAGNILMTAPALLASSTITGTSSASGGFMTFTFATPPTLTAGTQYGFVLKLAAARTGTQAVLTSDGDGLAGGRRQVCSTASCSNATGQSNDVVFISYMNVGFALSGNLVSGAKDANPATGLTPIWSSLSWTATTPANTTLRFQAAGSNSVTGPFNFVGPDGTAATFFTTSPASLSQFYNKRYVQYKAYLSTTSTAATPTLNDVTACYADVDCSGTTAPITPAPAQVCAGSSGNTASGPAGATSYAWSITNGTIQGSTASQSISYTAGASGIVTLTLSIVAPNGCHATNSTTVPINPVPATPTASNGGPYCAGATIALSTPTVAGATYAWTGPNGFTSALQNPTRANAATADAGTYSVTVTVGGCTSAAGNTSVVVNPIPATPSANNGGAYCAGGTISLSTPTVASATYAWTGPNGFTSALQNPTRANATTADAGTYSVTVTVNGCTSAAGTTSVVVNPIPATPTASNTGPYCTGGTISLSTATVANATYAWTGPNGFTSALQNPTRANATTADAGTYSVTVTVSGCTSAAGTTSVVVNQTPATPTASNGGPYCEGGMISLATPTVSGATYAWTGPNGFTSALQNPTRANATTADAGTYSVTVTVSGCTSAAGTTSVIVNVVPATPTAGNGGPYCAGGTISLTTPTVSGATYAWTGPNGFTSALQNPTRANATTADAGTYSVTVTVSGCTSAAGTTSVVVNAVPATPTASNGGPYCAGGTISLSTPTVASATYAWTGPNGFTSALQNPTRANATTADAGTYSVTVTVTGCTSAAGSTTVVVNAIPATPTASNTGPYCEGAMIALSTPTVSGATYAWTGPNGFTSALQNPTRANATTADAGTYSVTVTVSGCTSAAGTTSVVVNTVPATPTASNGGPYCAGATISLSTPVVSGATYAWTGPNGFTSALQNPTRANATTADAGTYSVTVTVTGCTSAAGTTSVVVNPIPATPTASNTGPYCEGGMISLTTPTVSGATYAWTGPNGFISALQNPTRANATTADAGTYSVTVTVSGCTSAAGTTSVVVNTTPATPSASNGGPYCEGASISLSTPTVAGATYAWTGPNGFTSALQNPTRSSVTVADAGTYSVTITVNNCPSAAGSTSVTVNPTPATPTASNDGPYCEGATISLTTPTVSGATYAWTGPNGFTSALQHPTRPNATTADAGTYSVTIVVNGCPSAAGTTSVVVNATPATPSASNGGPYCEGATIALFTPTVSGATYAWTGPNGFTSTQQNPTRANATTSDAGTYSVTVTVSGCSSAAGTTNVAVNPVPATPTASNGGPYCEGATISLSTPTVASATYAWTGPNGFTSTDQNPTRTNATSADGGTYSVTVTVNGCPSAAGTTSVVVNATPATPTASNGGPYCVGATISLSTSTVSGATYAWTGPNGFTSALQNPTRANATTADAGTYSVTVTVSGCTSAAGTTGVVVNPIPATPSASNGGPYCEGGTISLSTPTVAGATYAWTGPNGFTSAQQNPTRANVTTADAGTYSVTVTVSGCTSAAGTTNVVVNPTPATPTASNGGPYCEGATISLSTPTVSGATYAWTGPNGFTSALQNPTRSNATVADAGSYSVTVTVNGCPSAAGSTSVVVNPIPATPTASNGGPYCEGATISLSTPTVSGATYAWTGPNGFTSALQNPTRSGATTADAGSYSVTVTVNGCTSAAGSTTVVVNATPATPTASNGGPYCEGATISLSTPTVSGATYSWTGPNSFTSALQNPTRSNATVADAGSYSVTVTVNGCTSAAGSTTVVVNAAPATPTASNGGPYCEGATISLSTPTVSGATYAWTGPNGFTSALQNPTRSNATVADAGSYSVTVTVSGCTSAAGSTTVVVNPIPATPAASNGGPYCEGATIALSTPTVGGATYSWTGPNGFTSALQNPTRSNAIAAYAGTYSVTITVSGCTSAAGTTSVVVNAAPATPTASNGGPYCEGATISLSTPTVGGATYSWTGPNGFTSALQNPTRSGATVADAGSYFVTVTVSGCTSAAGSTSVVVNATPATPAATNGGPYCEGATISLFAPTVAGATYSWTGPNSFTSSLQNPTRSNATVADAGSYSVTVTVSGCTSAAGSTSVVVNATPATPTITPGGPTTFCAGGSVTLTSSSATGNQWFLNAGLITGATGNTYSAVASGNYTVVVTASGCSSAPSSAISVTVNPAPATPTITPGGPTTFCNGGSVLLTSSSATGYQWFLGGNPITGATNQTYSATASGNYTVVVSNGCNSAPSAPTTVTVNPIPATPTISAGGSTTFCEGGSVTLTSSSATGNQWYRNGVLLGSETSQTTVATLAGAYSVTTTASGCTSAQSAATIITVNPKPNVTISVPSPMYSGASGTASVIHECTGATFAWSITGGTITSGNGTRIITFTAGPAGTLTLFVTVTNSFGCSDSKTADVTVQQAPFGAPPYFSAAATSTTSVSMLWATVATADHYEIYRSTDNTNWTLRGTNTLATFSESGLTPSTTYLYKVRAIKADTTASGYSAIDPATTIVFTDPSLIACPTLIRPIHITELRTAINAARTTVGLTAFSFTDPSLPAGAKIKAIHVTELRTALAPVLSAIGVTPTYTDPTITAGTTHVKGTHIQELRDLVR